MSLSGALRPGERMTAAELAREPRMLHVVAWFGGEAAGSSGRQDSRDYPRRLTRDEADSWREGWREGRRVRVCHSWHGFLTCLDDHPATLAPPGFTGWHDRVDTPRSRP